MPLSTTDDVAKAGLARAQVLDHPVTFPRRIARRRLELSEEVRKALREAGLIR